MSLTFRQVAAFTNKPFAGNPAAVCLLTEPGEEEWLRKVAQELDLPATAFIYPEEDYFNLRWFTATAELELCGHGTLASAYVLYELGQVALDATVRFKTRSGFLSATRQTDWIELDLPSEPTQPVAAPPELLEALGVKPKFVGKSRLDYLVEVETEAELLNLMPDFALLKTVPTRGVIVTTRATTGQYDIVSRFFAPSVGINEDPVTGSAHCTLAPYWLERLGKLQLLAYQASRRGGTLQLRQEDNRVYLAGQAITIISGELKI